MMVYEYYLFYRLHRNKVYPLLTSRGIGYSCQKATRVSAPFTEGGYYGKGERPNTELASNSTLAHRRKIWNLGTMIPTSMTLLEVRSTTKLIRQLYGPSFAWQIRLIKKGFGTIPVELISLVPQGTSNSLKLLALPNHSWLLIFKICLGRPGKAL